MNRVLRVLSLSTFAAVAVLAAARPSHAQGTATPLLVGMDRATGALMPARVDLVRRPVELRIDLETGALSAVRGVSETAGLAAFLAWEPSTGRLVAVDLVAVRATAGALTLDPETGRLSQAGGGAPPGPAASGLTLVGLDAGGTLVPVDVGLTVEPGTYALDPRAGVVSPIPGGPALVGFDAAAGGLVLVRLRPVRGQGALSVDSRTGSLSRAAAPAAVAGPLALLGIRSDAGELALVDLDIAPRAGVLSVDPGTGALLPPRQEPAPDDRPGEPTILGVHYPTGGLTRNRVAPSVRPGGYAFDLPAGTVSLVAPPKPPPRGTESIVFGGGLDVLQMMNLKDVLAEVPGATEPDASTFTPGVHGFVEYTWRAISLGVDGAYSIMDTEVTFPQGLQTGDLNYLEFGGNVKVAVPLESRAWPYGTVAIHRAWTEADFEIEGLTEQRTHKSTRMGIGAGLDYWQTHWGLRLEGLYSTNFEENDAADHFRWRVSVMYSPGGLGEGRLND
ncbi:MAG TPA: outer membrane beta-barrel protein [Gemmatimonadota bacterium]